jgi:hypothetical protein
MTTLTDLRTSILSLLQDPSKYVFTDTEVDDGIKMALLSYSNALPLLKAQVITLARDGNEIDLSSISDIIAIQRVYYPWDSARTIDDQQPNQVKSWELYSDSGSATALLDTAPPYPGGESMIPATGEQVRIHYATVHTIAGLSGATATTVPTRHLDLIAEGAAGYALLSGAADRSEILDKTLLERLSSQHLTRFDVLLKEFAAASQRTSSTLAKWQKMDKYDRII